MDTDEIDELAARLKDGFRETVRNSDNGMNGPLSDIARRTGGVWRCVGKH